MAGSTKVGRNDRCPCGSGKKYKNCCADKARGLPTGGWVTIALMAVAAGVLLYLLVNAAQSDGSGPVGGRSCPPGQVWSAQHGHCH